jgi:acyl-CoA synthetase (NDP forming)
MTSNAPETDLGPMFNPRSVALVGAREGPRFPGRVVRTMVNFGFRGRFYPVNPKLAEVSGHKCYPSVTDLPETPDHVGIIVATERVFDVLEECAAKGVRFATVYSAGFSETGTPEGHERQAKLVAFARRTGMRIMGPNCNGVINFVDAFAMTSTGAVVGPRRPAGDIGVVSQSGGLGQVNVMWRAQDYGLGISYEASCGNEADLDGLDFARFMLRSEATNVVLLAIERVKSGDRLRDLAREAAEREKPLVVLKFGRTEAGRRAAASHTGAIAGSDDIYDAAFRQYGLIRVNDCNELYEMAVLLRKRRWPKSRRAASVAATGGNIVQLADVGATLGIEWPEYTTATQAKLAELMPGYGKVSNPTDMTSLATGEPTVYRAALEAIAADPGVDAMAPIYAFVPRVDIELAAQFVENCEKPAAMLWVGACTDDLAFRPRDLVARGVACYRDSIPCLRALRAAMDFGALVEKHRSGQAAPMRPAGLDRASALAAVQSAGTTLTEREAKTVLASYGLPVTREFLATTADEACAHARTLGTPVALKIESPDIAHKTEAGGVLLGVEGDAAVAAGYEQVLVSARRHAPDARINGVLVQEMAPAGVEMMLGVLTDAVFGPVIAVGLGGIHVEVLRDLAYRIAPVRPEDARAMLRELRGYRILEGVRGKAPCDEEAMVDAIVRLSWLAHDLAGDIAELDVNPVILLERGKGARVVDALIARQITTER